MSFSALRPPSQTLLLCLPTWLRSWRRKTRSLSIRSRMPCKPPRMWTSEIPKSRKQTSMPDVATGSSGTASWWWSSSFWRLRWELAWVLVYSTSAPTSHHKGVVYGFYSIKSSINMQLLPQPCGWAVLNGVMHHGLNK
jgi:hypothetical protein